MKKRIQAGAVALALIGGATAHAKWTELAAGQPTAVAASRLTVSAPARWNRSSSKPGKKAESWSFDGPLLNRVDFYGAIAAGEPLVKERNKKRDPLPKFAAGMGASEVAELFERTARITEQSTDFAIDTVAPVTFAGAPGFRFSYHFTGQSTGLVRKGLATGAVIGGRLYLVSYTAPGLHYYDTGLADAQAIMDSARLG